MGKGTLILALGVSILTSILIMNISANNDKAFSSTLDFYETTQSRLIANSGVEIYLEKLRRNKTLSGNFFDNIIMNGRYDIYIYGPDSLMTIKSVGKYRQKVHNTIVTASRSKITMPPINSAIYVSSTNVNLDLNGNMTIDGNDHDMNGNIVTGTSLPGIGVDNASDSAYVINTLKPKIANDIVGAGGTPSVSTFADATDWKKLTENLIFAADISLATGTYTTGTVLGTASEPKITYCSGDVHLSGDAYGYGIMIVNGNLELSGNFTFRGIVITYGQSTIETRTIGNAGIYGSSIFVGQNVSIQAAGNAKFLYSKSAIDNAKANLKSSRFQILSWWE
ncbi:MAG TPA: hypothetical protein VFF33_09130 [Ignavibacteriaceae bacterium]|nr:hypothetical protein [Ignavibacteriaceae bacterium]